MVSIEEAKGFDTLSRIAREVGLTGNDVARFVAFYWEFKGKKELERDGEVAPGYSHEWATRFMKKDEYVLADYNAFKILKKVDGAEARRYFDRSIGQLGWPREDVEEKWQRMLEKSGSERRSRRCKC
jgi:hypothetical protein